MKPAVAAFVAISGAALAGFAQPRSDETRVERNVQEQLYFVPAPAGVRAAASGFEEVASDLFWVRAVLLFGERYDSDHSDLWHTWLSQVVILVTELDPAWRTPYQYGGGMLRTVGEIDASDTIYERCTAELPLYSWCPFARGMNDLISREDPEAAAKWMVIAAARPDAPRWYGAAAAAMSSRAGQRRAGLAYLAEQLKITTDVGVRRDLLYQQARLRHDQLVSTWESACRALRASGGTLAKPEDLTALGFTLPENPRGDAWIVGNDGVVRSEGAERERVRRARQAEWALIRR